MNKVGGQMNNINILGIETSCDETAAAIVENGRNILANIVNSQIDIHQEFGGVVPEIASRKHIENITLVVDAAFKEAGMGYDDIDAVAITNAPGLVGALLVGLSFAKGFAYALEKPLIAVNHLHGHIYANFLVHDDIEFPAVCLIVSGGHTSILYMTEPGEYEMLGSTIDDAAGEAFDKVARFLGLGYPGGPAMQKAAATGEAGKYPLPRVFLNRKDLDFSFSGLKTAAMNQWKKNQQNPGIVNDLAAEFQNTLAEILTVKTLRAAELKKASTILLAGGVAANSALRNLLKKEGESRGLKVYYPPLSLCTDNAAMIAGSAYSGFLQGDFAALDLNAFASL